MRLESALPRQETMDGAGFQQRYTSIICSVDCLFEGPVRPFFSDFELVHLGTVDVLKYKGHGVTGGRRSLPQIRLDAIDDFLLLVPLTSFVSVSQSGNSCIVEPGTCTLLNTKHPFESRCGTAPNYTYAEYLIRMPGPILRQRMPYADQCCARPITFGHGVGKMLRSMIEIIVEERTEYSVLQAEQLGKILIDSVASLFLEVSCDGLLPLRKSAHARLYDDALCFIERHLSNPELTPSLIADQLHVSVSYLHAAFATSNVGVSALIRKWRLDRCRKAMLNPMMQDHSIIEIALQWGFNNASTFNRAYRSEFGRSPSEDRRSRLALLLPLNLSQS